jgi:hypothetical protein
MQISELVQTTTSDPVAYERGQREMERILQRSAVDREFRNALLDNPRAAFAEFAGVDVSVIPESFNLKFIENSADATIVLPDPVDPAAELTEGQLEAVAGGATPLLMGIAFVTGVAYGYTVYQWGHADGSRSN